jgi:hypothetical protein
MNLNIAKKLKRLFFYFLVINKYIIHIMQVSFEGKMCFYLSLSIRFEGFSFSLPSSSAVSLMFYPSLCIC